MADTELPEDLPQDAEPAGGAPTVKGLIDSSLNNANTLNAANILGVMANSTITSDPNNNANARTDGNRTNDS